MKFLNFFLVGFGVAFILVVPNLWWIIVVILALLVLSEAAIFGKKKIDEATK